MTIFFLLDIWKSKLQNEKLQIDKLQIDSFIWQFIFDNFFGFCLLDIWKSKLQIYKLTIDILEIDKFQLKIKISNWQIEKIKCWIENVKKNPKYCQKKMLAIGNVKLLKLKIMENCTSHDKQNILACWLECFNAKPNQIVKQLW